jgi:prepilin-type N-terminal cleavage/methylation domain-containing protein
MNSSRPNDAGLAAEFHDRLHRAASSRSGGFSFVELLVAIAIGAIVVGTAALAYHAVAGSARQRGIYQNIAIGPQANANFYALDSAVRSAWFAPNYGMLARSEQMRSLFLEDVQKSAGVFCLPRTGFRYTHPQTLNLTGTNNATNFDFRRMDTSEAFRQFLAAAGSAPAVSTFTVNPFAASGAAKTCNLSIFTVRSYNGSTITFGPTYELDFVRVSEGQPGTFASVRRYIGADRTTPSEFYEIFYADQKDGTAVNSTDFYVAASFERSGRTATTTVAGNRIADSQPFYFVWWPDPISTKLPSGTTYQAAMADETSYFMVVPMFPSL